MPTPRPCGAAERARPCQGCRQDIRVRDAGTVDWDTVLRAPGWSDGQRSLIHLAVALCGGGRVPPGAIGAHLTGRQTSPVLAMCQAARRRKPADLGACQGRDLDGSTRRHHVTLMATERVVIGTTTC